MSAWAFCTERFQASEGERVFLGSDLIEWMVREGKCETEIEAQVKAAAMVSMGLFLPCLLPSSLIAWKPRVQS
jgi:hypothetical protein